MQKRQDDSPRWRPDFRLVERLPDTKMVRTKFVIHFFAISLFFILIAVVGYREFVKMELGKNVQALENERKNRIVADNIFSKYDREFRTLVNRIKDIEEIKKMPMHPSLMLVELSRMRTQDVIYDSIQYRNRWDTSTKEEVFEIRLYGKGRTTADISELKNRLQILEVNEAYQISVREEGNPTKDAETGVFSFIINLRITEVKDGNR